MSTVAGEQHLAEVAVADNTHDESPSTQTILLNVGAQIINVAIFLFIFVKFFGGKIKKQLQEREEDIVAIAHAKEEYADIISTAQTKVDQMILEGKEHKEKLLQEGALLGKKKEEEIISTAEAKAESLIAQAQGTTQRMQDELENEFISSVKHVSKLVVHKLAGEDTKLQDAYLEKLAQEFTSHRK